MAKKAKRRGSASTIGQGARVGLHCRQPFLSAVDAWRKRQRDKPARSAAILRLAGLGLSVSGPRARTSERSASRASAMAGREIDRLSDPSASAAERARRKRRLLRGPGELRRSPSRQIKKIIRCGARGARTAAEVTAGCQKTLRRHSGTPPKARPRASSTRYGRAPEWRPDFFSSHRGRRMKRVVLTLAIGTIGSLPTQTRTG